MTAFLERLTVPPDGDLEGALGLLQEVFGVRAAALVEWPPDREPLVLAAAGKPEALPPRGRLFDCMARFTLSFL